LVRKTHHSQRLQREVKLLNFPSLIVSSRNSAKIVGGGQKGEADLEKKSPSRGRRIHILGKQGKNTALPMEKRRGSISGGDGRR